MEPAHILLIEDCAGDSLLVQQALASIPIPVKLHIARDGEQGFTKNSAFLISSRRIAVPQRKAPYRMGQMNSYNATSARGTEWDQWRGAAM